MSNEREVKLPSGGIVYVLDVVPHSAATTLRKHHLRIGRYMGATRDLDGAPTREFRADLTSEQLDEKDDLITGTEALYIRTLTIRWEGVTSAFGEPLTFPDDVERMREPDLQHLAGVLFAGRADPNAPEPPSGSSSEPETSPTTLTSGKTSARS